MTIFEKIINREIPADIVHETDDILAFRDINPQAPTHILVIPKRPIAQLSDLTDTDEAVMGKVMVGAADVARKLNINDYRVVINSGPGAGQTVFHIHAHLLAGRSFTWPPG